MLKLNKKERVGFMKKKVGIAIVILILLVVGIFIFIGIKIANSAIDMLDVIPPEEYMEEEFETQNLNVISGTGQITSFMTEELETEIWSKIDKVLVSNETSVKANQEILNVSNSEMTGKIYSTISGQFIIQSTVGREKYFIYDLDNLGFELDIDEKEVTRLKIGQKVEATVQASNEKVERKNLLYFLYSTKRENKSKS